MPVTAKLSRKFYEQFGDDLTNELVNWMNQVDGTYRAEFRDLFEVHFARFDAKLEQRLAELKADLRTEIAATPHGCLTSTPTSRARASSMASKSARHT